jgi:hypothetical protein
MVNILMLSTHLLLSFLGHVAYRSFKMREIAYTAAGHDKHVEVLLRDRINKQAQSADIRADMHAFIRFTCSVCAVSAIFGALAGMLY